jgi:hypothetical protein
MVFVFRSFITYWEPARRAGHALSKQKSARELRQGGSNYRCCIPALAGFVSPQSIAPDGKRISLQDCHRATASRGHRHVAAATLARSNAMLSGKPRTLTICEASVCIDAVKWFAWLLLVFLLVTVTSCTTLVNRRDLYSPEPGPDSLEAARQWYGVTTTRTTTTTTRSEETVPAASVRRY